MTVNPDAIARDLANVIAAAAGRRPADTYRDAILGGRPESAALTSTQILAGLALAQTTDADGVTEAPLPAVADRARLGLSTTREAIRRLIAAGWLELLEADGQPADPRSAYRLTLPTITTTYPQEATP